MESATIEARRNGAPLKGTEMQTNGKFYIWLNDASAQNYYWMTENQNWTRDPLRASFFDTAEDAALQREFAEEYGPGEAVILRATRDL